MTENGSPSGKQSPAPQHVAPSLSERVAEGGNSIAETRHRDLTAQGLSPDTEYRVDQIEHAFPFGTAINFAPVLFDQTRELGGVTSHVRDRLRYAVSPAFPLAMYFHDLSLDRKYPQAYMEAIAENFNGGVEENLFKWEMMSTRKGPNYSATDKVMELLVDHPSILKNFRGHTVFWNRRKRLPRHMRNQKKTDIKKSMLAERTEMVQRYPQIKEWDLINEPIPHPGETNGEIIFDPKQDIDTYVELFQRARDSNPEASFYVNEFGLLCGGPKLQQFIGFISELQSRGVDVGGIGVQGHMDKGIFATPEKAKESLDKLAVLGIPIKITEFDVSDEMIAAHYGVDAKIRHQSGRTRSSAHALLGRILPDQKSDEPDWTEKRAEYVDQMLTVFFGHPSVAGVYFWGFENRSHWRARSRKENVALFEETPQGFKPNAVGKVYLQRTRKDWMTQETVKTDSDGKLSFRGFPGKYRVVRVDSHEDGQLLELSA